MPLNNGLPNRGEAAPNPSFPWEALSAVGGTLGALLSVFLVVLALVKAGLIETNRLLATVERLRGRNGGNNGGANVPPTQIWQEIVKMPIFIRTSRVQNGFKLFFMGKMGKKF